MAKRVSIINFKGGVGKTTLAFNFAAGLARYHGARVLLVDMDHQSSLSIVCLGSDVWQRVAESGDTVNRVFKNFLGSTLPGREIIHSSQFGEHESYRARVDIVPADLDLDDTEIELTSSHQGNPASCITFLSEQAFAPQNTRFWSRRRVWFQFTVGEDKPPMLSVDNRGKGVLSMDCSAKRSPL